MHDTIEPTWEAGTKELAHPDATVRNRLVEAVLGACESGCKVYADPLSGYTVLAHNSTYGCTKEIVQ